jgi:hypothetical protein
MLVDARKRSKAGVPSTYENILTAPKREVRKTVFWVEEAVAEVASEWAWESEANQNAL